MKLATLFLLVSTVAAGDCVSITAARKYLNDSVCVTGKVVKVAVSQRSGTHFLNFCDDYRNCPFSVVVFARDLPRVGNVRWLEGKTIEIYGKVKDYKGQAEIILSDVRQLKGESAKLPPLPKHYDVETRGNYSAGEFKSGSTVKKPKRKSKRETDERAGEADPANPD
jgi:DNA/RNA endonuclease YhcR with UshA esterase domain